MRWIAVEAKRLDCQGQAYLHKSQKHTVQYGQDFRFEFAVEVVDKSHEILQVINLQSGWVKEQGRGLREDSCLPLHSLTLGAASRASTARGITGSRSSPRTMIIRCKNVLTPPWIKLRWIRVSRDATKVSTTREYSPTQPASDRDSCVKPLLSRLGEIQHALISGHVGRTVESSVGVLTSQHP